MWKRVAAAVRNTPRRSLFKISCYSVILTSSSIFAYSIYRETHPIQIVTSKDKKRLLVLGSGWGTVSLLKSIDPGSYNVTVVSPRPQFVFTPWLPFTLSNAMSPRTISEPTRNIAKRSGAHFVQGTAEDIDPTNKTVKVRGPGGSEEVRTFQYDLLCVGVGAGVNTFGIHGVKENAMFFKDNNDVTQIRHKIKKVLENADFSQNNNEPLNFVVVGAGPTGVEVSVELQDWIHDTLAKTMPHVAQRVKITLVEALPNVLNMFHPDLIKYSQDNLIKQGIDLKLNHSVQDVSTDHIIMKDMISGENRDLSYSLLIWSTGNTPLPITKSLMNKLSDNQNDKRGLLIDDYLKVEGTDSIFAIGDCTFHKGWAPTAQVAFQQGEWLAKYLKSLSKNKISNISPFIYHHRGTMCYIGNQRAIAEISSKDKNNPKLISGEWVFGFWRMASLSMNITLRNKMFAINDWLKVWIWGKDPTL